VAPEKNLVWVLKKCCFLRNNGICIVMSLVSTGDVYLCSFCISLVIS
jgi:hypothetical protein